MNQESLILPTSLRIKHFNCQMPIVVNPITNDKQKTGVSSTFKAKLELLAKSDRPAYPASFISAYLLLKLNNLALYVRQTYASFIQHLSIFYNQYLVHNHKYAFKWCQNDSELIAQVLLNSETYRYLDDKQAQELLNSCGIIVASMVQSYFRVAKFLEKDEYAVAMSLVSLYARLNPFIAIVHKDKNHQGECDYAAKIFQYMQLDPKVQKPKMTMVQDAYSLRCSPQVYGVVYDCLSQLKQQLQLSLNKPQFRQISINGTKMRNLSFRSETETLILDSLICSLNEIGHMSFLRSERILNSFLSENHIKDSPFFELFKAKLMKVSYDVVHNKALATSTNSDTVIMNEYKHDIYVDEGTPFIKMHKMLASLTKLMELEIMEATEVLSDVYGKEKRLFGCEAMEKVYRRVLSGRESGYEGWARSVDQWVKE